MSRDLFVNRAVGVIVAIQAALVVFGALSAQEAAAVAGVAIAFFGGYHTMNDRSK